jgi:hypothetical protein
MKKIVLILKYVCLSVGLLAQEDEQNGVALNEVKLETLNFKPRYAGTSVDAGFMFMPHNGSAFYVAPKLNFQVSSRSFVNAGIGVVQYNLLPSQQIKNDGSLQRTVTGTYIFVEGMYLLSERCSINGSVMKDVSPVMLRRSTPYSVTTEAMHFGVDYRITPNITVGARVGYSNGGRSSIFDY